MLNRIYGVGIVCRLRGAFYFEPCILDIKCN